MLETCRQQQPNVTWLGMPWRLWSYQLGQRRFDRDRIRQRIASIEADFTAKIALAKGDDKKVQHLKKKREKQLQVYKKLLAEGNMLMRWGEAPVFYSLDQRKQTEQNLLVYLQSKSYFDAQVSSVVKLQNQWASVTYHVQENFPYLIKEFRLKTADPLIEKLLKLHWSKSVLKKGAPYDQEVLQQERERIYELLSNHGYFNFDRQYIWFEINKSVSNHSVVIETVVETPVGSQAHPRYHIAQVTWDVDASLSKRISPGASILSGGIIFKNLHSHFNPQVLARKLPLRPPQLYRKKDLFEAHRRLTRLNMFRYVNISYDVTAPESIVPRIHTVPVDRFQLTNELGLQVSQWLPMPFYKLALTSKNLFGRLETLQLATHVGVEGLSATAYEKRISSSDEVGVDLSLSWPQFLFPLSDATRDYLERFNPQTELSVGYNFNRRPAYTQNVFNSFLSYTWQGQAYGTYEFIPFRVDLLDTYHLSEVLEQRLEMFRKQRNNLYESFQPSWVSLFSFRSRFCNKPETPTDRSYWGLELFFESGGALQNFFDLRKIMPNLTYYKYAKLKCNYSQYIPIRPSTILAYCVNAGIASPYGESKVLPYNRYYFIGGRNDIRAWSPRSLGPGTYSPPESRDKFHVEQPGELLLHGSVELRQQLVGALEGALFVDMGNVWTLRQDGRLGGQFSQDFYKALALGTGVGMRLNFGFLVLRLDLGLKLYDPILPLGERFVGHKLALSQAVFNFGIGYPF